MKKKDLATHKSKPPIEMEKELRTNREKLEGLKFDLVAGKVKNIREIRHLKKNIAQILTILKEDKLKQNHA